MTTTATATIRSRRPGDPVSPGALPPMPEHGPPLGGLTADVVAQTAKAIATQRLEAYRAARAALHDDVVRAAELGLTQAQIAAASGLTRQWVARILARRAEAASCDVCERPTRPGARFCSAKCDEDHRERSHDATLP